MLYIYILLLLAVLLFGKNFISFLFRFYSKPLLLNRYSDFIPSKELDKEKFIVNKDGSFSIVLVLEGASYFGAESLETAKAEAHKIKDMTFNLKEISENIDIKFIFKRFRSEDSFINSNYITLTAINKKELEQTATRFLTGLNLFKPSFVKSTDLIKFLYSHCNLYAREITPNILEKLKTDINLYQLCSGVEVQFNEQGIGQLYKLGHHKYFKCVSLDFGGSINDKYFHEIITSDIECEYIINTKFLNKARARSLIGTDKNNITASSDKEAVELQTTKFKKSIFGASKKKINEINEAEEILDNEEACLIQQDSFIFMYGSSLEELEKASHKLSNMISKYEITMSDEKYLLNFFFLQRLIGFRFQISNSFKTLLSDSNNLLIYAKKMLSSTLAGLVDYINTPKGLTRCDWGEFPLAKLSTNYNSLYNFYLHVEEKGAAVGHGVVIAPTGAGKTTFIQYVMMGILANYKEVDIYAFDRFRGMSVFTNWQNGKDINFNQLAINPLQLDLAVVENKEFLHHLLSMLGKPANTKDKEIIHNFIALLDSIPVENRILKNLVQEYIPASDLKDNLQMWCRGKYEHYLNAEVDNFELDSNFMTFQMDNILDDEELSAPIISYVMFKIRQKARSTGRGHFVFIDETAKMLRNAFFRSQVEVLLDEHRKLRGCVWLAFQNSNAFLNDKGLKQSIANQCKNTLLFSSDGVNSEVLAELNIDKSVYNEVLIAKKYYANPYFALLKRPSENVILNINLTDKVGDNMKFLSSTSSDVNRMEELKAEYGEEWREHY